MNKTYPYSDLLSNSQNGNILISLYMGAILEEWYPPSKDYNMSGLHLVYPVGTKENPKILPDNRSWHCAGLLKYDSDWNWLMPVINTMYNDTNLNNNYADYLFESNFWKSFNCDIKLLFNTVVDILRSHNE